MSISCWLVEFDPKRPFNTIFKGLVRPCVLSYSWQVKISKYTLGHVENPFFLHVIEVTTKARISSF